MTRVEADGRPPPGSFGAAVARSPTRALPSSGPPLTVLHALAPARFGGIERVVQALATGHATAGHDVHVSAVLTEESADAHPFLRSLRSTGVHLHVARLPSRAYFRQWAHIRRISRQARPDVVHTHGYRSDVVDSDAARREGIPTLSSVHGFTGGGWKNRFYERLQRRAYRYMDAVVAVSRAQVGALVAAGVPRHRIQVLPNAWSGSAPPLPPAYARALLDVRRDAFHIGWVGRLSHEKGGDVLLDALPLLRDLEPVVSILGTGRRHESLRRRAEDLGVGRLVRWHGEVDGAGRLFAAFDTFVLSSRTEGTPIVLFEAMAARTPIVATTVGGVPDVVTPGEARLVPPEDPRALAAAIRSIRRAPAGARRRAETAHRRLREQFAGEPWLRRYEALYRRLAHEHSTVPSR